MSGLVDDLRFAARGLVQRPGFTAVALLTLALGIGANVAIFSVADAALWAPLPYPEAERLVLVSGQKVEGGRGTSVSHPDFLDWRDGSDTVDLAAVAEASFVLGGAPGRGDTAERVAGEWISAGYLSVLGVEPAQGRDLAPRDDTAGAPPVVLLSWDLWQRRHGGDRSLVGRTVRLGGAPYTVAGILPRGFTGVTGRAEVFLPFAHFDALNPELVRYDILRARGTRWHRVVGRLAPGADLDAASAELASIAAALRTAHPDSNQDQGVVVTPLRDELVGDLRPAVTALLAAVGCVLLIGCANLVHLLLARAAGRRREMAVRTALGAGRARLLRQLLSENLLLALAGGAAGTLLAFWSVDLLVRFLPLSLPPQITPSLDGRALLFAAVASLLAGLAAGMPPALGLLRRPPSAALATGSGAGGGRSRLSATLVAAEVATALVLLVGAALLLASLAAVLRFDPGFRAEGLLTLRFELPARAADPQRQPAVRTALMDAVEAVPGVAAAAGSTHVFYGGGYMSRDVTTRTAGAGLAEHNVYVQYVGAGYFRALGVPLLAGRGFTAADRADSPPVVAVGRSLAAELWPGRPPLEQQLKIGGPDGDGPWARVVAVVDDVWPRLRERPGSRLGQIYLPLAQGGEWGRALLVRAAPGADPAALAPELREAARRVDPGIALWSVAPMDELLAEAGADTRSLGTLIALFALLALVLAVLGIYGVTAHAAARRVHEVGVRMTLGARRRDILGLFLGRGLLQAAAGVAAGLAAALVVVRLLRHHLAAVLYEVDPASPGLLAAATLLTLTAALLGTWLPAHRAARTDPARVLRRE